MNPHDIFIQADLAARLRATLEEHGDEELTLDMVEGQTSLFELLDSLAEARAEDLSMVTAIKARQDDLSARKARLEERAQTRARLIHRALEHAAIRKLERPTYTAHIQAGRASAVITDEESLAPRFIRTRHEPNKAEILSALKAGEVVDGACFNNAPDILVIKSK